MLAGEFPTLAVGTWPAGLALALDLPGTIQKTSVPTRRARDSHATSRPLATVS